MKALRNHLSLARSGLSSRALAALALAASGCGGDAESDAELNGLSHGAACGASPLSTVEFGTEEELQAILVGRWQRCDSAQARGEEVGVEFAADGRWYALSRNGAGDVVRRQGIDYGGSWTYYPAGSIHPISDEPSASAFLILDQVITSPPTITINPVQMRILFSPVPSRYVPIE